MSTAELIGPTVDPASAHLNGERVTAVDGEGWLYDVETGEVLGLSELPDDFEVNCHQAADRALEIRSRIEAQVVAVKARRDALNRQLDALERAQESRLKWWDWRFGQQLAAFARSLLSGKSKTARFTWGSVAFRATKGTNRITDMDAAVEWVRRRDPEMVKVVETTTVTAVLALSQGKPLPFLESTGPGEAVTISTGIDTKARAHE